MMGNRLALGCRFIFLCYASTISWLQSKSSTQYNAASLEDPPSFNSKYWSCCLRYSKESYIYSSLPTYSSQFYISYSRTMYPYSFPFHMQLCAVSYHSPSHWNTYIFLLRQRIMLSGTPEMKSSWHIHKSILYNTYADISISPVTRICLDTVYVMRYYVV